MASAAMKYEPGSHAGELDDETLSETWDHLLDGEEDPTVPEFNEETLSFFRAVNGIAPTNTSVNQVRIVRFLNFCNDYLSTNVAIAKWHIVRNRRWIADRLDPLVIPIAELAHGDYLCLDFADSPAPRVIRWDHERSRPGNPQYHRVSPNLAAFVAAINQQST